MLDGPSLDVLQHGHTVKCGNDKQNWLWDDALSDQDRDIICGIYKVYTSQFFFALPFIEHSLLLIPRQFGVEGTDHGFVMVAKGICFRDKWLVSWLLDS